jgi:C1A family cysteine protease
VTNVKNQGGCGSCWAFAGVAEIESFFLWKHKLYLDLSEQQMVDCATLVEPTNKGCGGGRSDAVVVYSVQYPISEETSYPYTAQQGDCNTAKVNAGEYKISSYYFIEDCNDLTNNLLTKRPISVCMMIDTKWQSYQSGVIPDCNDVKTGGHCVLLVGAKSDGTTNPLNNYWIVRNSWSSRFGEYGFMRLYRNPNQLTTGFCGICNNAVLSQ